MNPGGLVVMKLNPQAGCLIAWAKVHAVFSEHFQFSWRFAHHITVAERPCSGRAGQARSEWNRKGHPPLPGARSLDRVFIFSRRRSPTAEGTLLLPCFRHTAK